MDINIRRKKILMKGYAGISDVQRFLKCGNRRASKVMIEIFDDIARENKKTMPEKVPAKRLLPYLDISEKRIFEYAEMEEKEKGPKAIGPQILNNN